MSARRSPGPRRARRLGYTMIEVMVALSLLAVGAAGIIALQKATLISNTNARNIALANAIAATWAERLRVDALQWNDPADVPDLASDTDWIATLGNPAYPAKVVPAEVGNLGAPTADVLGSDIFVGDPSVPAYCTHLRFLQYVDPITSTVILKNLIRVEIRVFWERNGNPVDCTVATTDVDQQPGRYGAVYLTTSVLQNKDPD